MKRILPLIGLLLLVTACGSKPLMQPLVDMVPDPDLALRCRSTYPRGSYQFWHSIQATLPGGSQQRMMGVSVVSSDPPRLDWALMTIEGLVLFQGSDVDGTVEIVRAVPPFDGSGFAKGMIEDLRFIWLMPPEMDALQTGSMSGRPAICRLRTAGGGFLDLVPELDGWTRRQYDARRQLSRSLTAGQMTSQGLSGHLPSFPEHMTLKRHSMAGYTLEMQLMEAIDLKVSP